MAADLRQQEHAALDPKKPTGHGPPSPAHCLAGSLAEGCTGRLAGFWLGWLATGLLPDTWLGWGGPWPVGFFGFFGFLVFLVISY